MNTWRLPNAHSDMEYVSSAGVYMLVDDGVPMQISIGQIKTMIPDYGDLFDLPPV